MALISTKLRPGLLVSLKTSLTGNVAYDKRTIEDERELSDGSKRARWETTKTIADPEEQARAEQTRNKANSLIRSVCVHSAFGLLCPEAKASELEAAIDEAHRLTAAFNASASLTRVKVYIITGRIAPDDVEAVRAINSEVRDLMADMARGIEAVDVKKIRDAASRAKAVGAMLTPEAANRVKAAVDVARSTARRIVKAGEQAAQVIDKQAIRQITDARTAFLDLDDAAEVDAPVETGRAIDLDPESGNEPQAMQAAPAAGFLFEME